MPIDQHARVSRDAFWDPDVHELELTKVFRGSWVFVAFDSELPNPGDYVTRRIGADPVIVSRGSDGSVSVLLNSCSHRGSAVCRGDSGNTRNFRCQYHGWTYDHGGSLIGVPEMGEVFGMDFPKGELGLPQCPRVQVVYGLIFASWNADVPPLEEYLGDLMWYLQAAFGRTVPPFQVMGPPSRNILKTNWKIAAENFGGDGYHLSITHKSIVDIGVFGDPRNMPEVIDGREHPAHNILFPNGNSVRVQQMPMKFPEPQYFGYPEELWGEFSGNLDEAQQEMMSGLVVIHGNIFPNFSWLDVYQMLEGSGEPPCSYLVCRQWQPLAADATEVFAWGLAPSSASPDFIRASRRALIRTNHIGGSFDLDDINNWQSMRVAVRGQVTRQPDYIYAGGAQLEPTNDVPWPGEVYASDHTELNQRNMHRHWRTVMYGED